MPQFPDDDVPGAVSPRENGSGTSKALGSPTLSQSTASSATHLPQLSAQNSNGVSSAGPASPSHSGQMMTAPSSRRLGLLAPSGLPRLVAAGGVNSGPTSDPAPPSTSFFLLASTQKMSSMRRKQSAQTHSMEWEVGDLAAQNSSGSFSTSRGPMSTRQSFESQALSPTDSSGSIGNFQPLRSQDERSTDTKERAKLVRKGTSLKDLLAQRKSMGAGGNNLAGMLATTPFGMPKQLKDSFSTGR